MFGTKNGWERADYFRPGEPWRRAGEDQRAFGWTRRRGTTASRVEHAAIRERVGIVDMTSFGKLEVSGPGRSALLERVCDNRIDRPVGSVVYTQLLDDARRHRRRRDRDAARRRSLPRRHGAGAVDSDRGLLELNGDATVRSDVTDELAVIGMWGPRAREVLAAVTRTTSRTRRSRSARAGRSRSAARRRSRSGSPTSASSAASSTCHASGRCRSGTSCVAGSAGTEPVGYRRSTHCGSRRATATSAPT